MNEITPSLDLYSGWINFACKPSTVPIIRRGLFSDVAAVSKIFFSLSLVVITKTTQSYFMLHLPAIQSTPADVPYKVIVNTTLTKILQPV